MLLGLCWRKVRGISKIVDKVQGKSRRRCISCEFGGAGISAGIKGLITFGTLLTDIFRDENLPVDETLTAKFNSFWSNNVR